MAKEKEVKKEVTAEVKEAPVMKQRKPREKMRPYEELMSLSEKKLTDAEKNFLIKKLKEEVNLKTNQCNACHEVIDSSFNKSRQLEEDYKSMEVFYQEKLKYINNQLNSFHAALNMAIKGGVQ